MSEASFVSPGTRLRARDQKATRRPSAEIEGQRLRRSLCFGPPRRPLEVTLTRLVSPVLRSRTKTSMARFASWRTRFEASETKATRRPSAEIEGEKLLAFAC